MKMDQTKIEEPHISEHNFEPQPTIQNSFNKRVSDMCYACDAYAMNRSYENWRLTLETLHRSLMPLMNDGEAEECKTLKKEVRKSMNAHNIGINRQVNNASFRVDPKQEAKLVDNLGKYDVKIRFILFRNNLLMN